MIHIYQHHYCGNLATQEVDDEIAKVQQKMSDDFVTWIPIIIKSSIITVPPKDTPMSGTFVANNTALKSVFQRISAQFAKLYKRKAFLHWYNGEGMDEMKFHKDHENLRDLVTEYQDKQDAVVDEDGDEDDAVLANGFKLKLRDKEKNEQVVNHYLILFWCAIIFIIVPLVG